MLPVLSLLSSLTTAPLSPAPTDDSWLRFTTGRSTQVFERTVRCDRPTTFRFSIGRGPAMRAEVKLTPRDYRDDTFEVVRSAPLTAIASGALVGIVSTGVHAITVRPACGTSAQAKEARVLISLRLRQRLRSTKRLTAIATP